MNESQILIFGGTMEGRLLAESCARSAIPADVCVVSQTGSDLIEECEGLNIHVGALDAAQIEAVLRAGSLTQRIAAGSEQNSRPASARRKSYLLVIDATHPYAKEATQNIRSACEKTQTPYLRVKRESEPVASPVFDDLDAIISFLNDVIDGRPDKGAVIQTAAGDPAGRNRAAKDGKPEPAGEAAECSVVILSVLGGKSLERLTAIHGFAKRLWVRVLPSDEMLSHAVSLGYPAEHVIMEKGPFTVEQNLAHLRRSGAGYMITKESGQTGGYPQKAEAAALSGVTLLTLRREPEEGVSVTEAMERIRHQTGG